MRRNGPTFPRDETFASRGQADHNHTYPRVLDLHALAISLPVMSDHNLEIEYALASYRNETATKKKMTVGTGLE